jgi:hypothetical protein
MIERRWVLRCDEPDCNAVLVCPPPDDVIYGDDKGNAGISAVECGWDARPNRRETYCPEHDTELL